MSSVAVAACQVPGIPPEPPPLLVALLTSFVTLAVVDAPPAAVAVPLDVAWLVPLTLLALLLVVPVVLVVLTALVALVPDVAAPPALELELELAVEFTAPSLLVVGAPVVVGQALGSQLLEAGPPPPSLQASAKQPRSKRIRMTTDQV